MEQIKGTPFFFINCVMIPTVKAQRKRRHLTPHYTLLHLTTPHLITRHYTSPHQIFIPSEGFTTFLPTVSMATRCLSLVARYVMTEQVGHSQRVHPGVNKMAWCRKHNIPSKWQSKGQSSLVYQSLHSWKVGLVSLLKWFRIEWVKLMHKHTYACTYIHTYNS